MSARALADLIDAHAVALAVYARQWCGSPDDAVQVLTGDSELVGRKVCREADLATDAVRSGAQVETTSARTSASSRCRSPSSRSSPASSWSPSR